MTTQDEGGGTPKGVGAKSFGGLWGIPEGGHLGMDVVNSRNRNFQDCHLSCFTLTPPHLPSKLRQVPPVPNINISHKRPQTMAQMEQKNKNQKQNLKKNQSPSFVKTDFFSQKEFN